MASGQEDATSRHERMMSMHHIYIKIHALLLFLTVVAAFIAGFLALQSASDQKLFVLGSGLVIIVAISIFLGLALKHRRRGIQEYIRFQKVIAKLLEHQSQTGTR